MSNPSIDAIAEEYASATKFFLDCAGTVTTSTIDVRHPNGWSARQVIHHVADSEAQSYARLRRLLAEPSPVIQGYDEAAWAQSPVLGYSELPTDNALAVFTAVRAASLDLIRRLRHEDLDTAGMHTESGPYTVATWLANYSRHPVEHGEQLLRALRAEE